MKYLLMILLTACGADPDDYKVQESDGCPSSGCVVEGEKSQETVTTETKTETKSETTTTTTTKEEPPAFVCAENKLCKGMTKGQVLAVMGDPASIKRGLYPIDSVIWIYEDDALTPHFCLERFRRTTNDCDVVFLKNGLLYETDDVLATWLDPLGF